MPRLPRLDYPGALHHVIIRGIERRYIFDDPVDKDLFLDRFGDDLARTGCSCYAWCLMGNHGHFLLRSGPKGLAPLLRSALTWYAVRYNRTRRRAGHLFQNRYHSIVCEEDTYFLQLVRYIHLNPYRVGIVRSLKALASYPWTGHSVLLGREDRPWQDQAYVMSHFGGEPGAAMEAYLQFVGEGMGLGKEDLERGGLLASAGGLSGLHELKRRRERWAFDSRVLGGGPFVEDATYKAGRAMDMATLVKVHGWTAEYLLGIVAQHFKVGLDEIRRQRRAETPSAARAFFAYLSADFTPFPRKSIEHLLNVSQSGLVALIQRGRTSPRLAKLDPAVFLVALNG